MTSNSDHLRDRVLAIALAILITCINFSATLALLAAQPGSHPAASILTA